MGDSYGYGVVERDQFAVERYVPGLNKPRKILSSHEKQMLQKRKSLNTSPTKSKHHPSGRHCCGCSCPTAI